MFAIFLTYVVRAIIQKLLENVIVLETEKPNRLLLRKHTVRKLWANSFVNSSGVTEVVIDLDLDAET